MVAAITYIGRLYPTYLEVGQLHVTGEGDAAQSHRTGWALEGELGVLLSKPPVILAIEKKVHL